MIAVFTPAVAGSKVISKVVLPNEEIGVVGIAVTLKSAASVPVIVIKGLGSVNTKSAAPEFNIVGTSGANQIADVVASQAPVKAYVVANDVTTAQALDRNIVEGATL